MQRNTVCHLEEYLISKHTLFQSGEACIFGRTSKHNLIRKIIHSLGFFALFLAKKVQQNDVEGMNISSYAYPSLK